MLYIWNPSVLETYCDDEGASTGKIIVKAASLTEAREKAIEAMFGYIERECSSRDKEVEKATVLLELKDDPEVESEEWDDVTIIPG